MPVRPQDHSDDGPTSALDTWMVPFDQDAAEAEQRQQLEERQQLERQQRLVEEGEEATPGGRLEIGDAGVEVADQDEGRRPAALRAPNRVTQAEREEHELTHIPYRQWCPICVKARGRSTPHRSRTEEQRREGVPKISLDYFFMSSEEESATDSPVLVMIDESTGERYARAVGQKGLGEAGEGNWLVQDMSEELKSWGHAGGRAGHNPEIRWRTGRGCSV